ncbi:hypothetical protein SAMN04488035_0946 [Flavimobilis marinus]|uniref:Spermidine synthase n=1 Tax=Flavimobilis marinus TaxID=285351 RepID=A0A1I2E9A6_9MICO|nr:fused MFS/spermidine synthase [Flavimobilis marinus]SFE89229.1 hypothetical protein SAMN04488035_0946 [Flavimobilis marinus]
MARRPARSRSSSAPLTRIPSGPVVLGGATVEAVPDRDDPEGFTLLVDGVPSSYLRLGDPGFLGFEYMQQMAAVLALLPGGPLDVVHVGAAGCALARHVEAARPGSRQIGIDPVAELLERVREWFDLPRSPALRLRAGDGRAVLEQLRPASADVVVRDAFAPDVTPGHLATTEFHALARRTLRPGGLYLLNVADRAPLRGVREELASVGAAFDGCQVALVAEPGVLKGRRYGNLVVAALAPTTEEDSTRLPDLGGAALARAVRSLAAPSTILTGGELATFVGQAPTRHDPPAS